MASIGERLDECAGVGPGFNLLRLMLSVSVVAWHSFEISHDSIYLDAEPVIWFGGYAVVFMFFALSGFLVTASALRLTLTDFLINRGLRIVPALFMEVCLCVFVLGPAFTTYGGAGYFFNGETLQYLTNIIGFIHYTLPGVFTSNPNHIINFSLWTVPFEMSCYALMASFMIAGLLKYPVAIFAAAFLFIGAGLLFASFGASAAELAHGAQKLFTTRGSRVLLAFMLGIATYLFRYRIAFSGKLALLALVTAACAAILTHDYGFAWVNAIVGVPLAYLTIYFGLSPFPAPPPFRSGDYSYGIYLYGMPIQQAMIGIFPDITSPIVQAALALPTIIAFASLSWHTIEKPILRFRRRGSPIQNYGPHTCS